MKKRGLSLMLALALVLQLFAPIIPAAEAAGNQCGSSAFWSVSDDTLTISGTGAMQNYGWGEVPWYEEIYGRVVVDEGITHIGDYAFADGAIYSLELPSTLKSIGVSAFDSVTFDTAVVFPEGLESIGGSAFAYSSVYTVFIPASVTSIADSAFEGCSDFVIFGYEGSYAEDWAASFGYTFKAVIDNRCGDDITYAINGDTVTFTGTGAMYDMAWDDSHPWEACTTAIVGEGITHLGSYLFYTCAVEEVSLPSTLLTIGTAAFGSCYNLNAVDLPTNLVSIGTNAFYECVGLTQIALPDTLSSIGPSAFERSGLTAVTIPESVQSIGEYAFAVIPGIVYVKPGTYAEQYAREAGISYALLDNTPPVIVSVSPSTGTTITGPMTITVTASDDNGLDHVTMNGVDYPASGSYATVEIPYDPTSLYPGYHYLDIYAYDLSGNSVSEFYWLIYVTGPEAPTGFAAGESSNGITLSWNPGEAETLTGYLLQRATDGVNFADIATLDLDTVRYVDTDTRSGVTYTYRLYPLWSEGEGDFAQVSWTYGDYVAPEAPVVTVSPETAGGTVNPVLSISAEDDLSLDRVVLSLADTGARLAELVSANKEAAFRQNFTWPVTGLESGSYSIRVVAYDTVGNVGDETVVTVTVDNTAPPCPTGFYAEATTGYIHVMWDTDYPVPDDFVRFELYRSDAPDGVFTKVSSGTGVGYYDHSNSIDTETTYYYYAVAVDRLGNVSAPTELVSAKLLTDTQSPEIVDMAPVSNSTICKEVTLQVSAMDDYRLDRAVFYYLDGENWVTIDTDEAEGTTNSTIFSADWTLPEQLTGKVTVKAEVYDAMDNAPAVQTRILNVLAYEQPAQPEITVETGFQRVTLSWSYDKDLLRTLRHFVIYQTDANGESRSQIATVSRGANSKYTLSIEKDVVRYYVVEAVDCYGAAASSQVLEVISAPDTTAPTAQLRASAALAAIGQEVVFSGELSTDNDGIAAYEWDLNGDGIVDQTGVRCVHQFDAAGTYCVKLTVRDLSGNETTAETSVEVCDTEDGADAYTQLWINVVNAYDEDSTPVSGAEVTVRIDSEDFEAVGFTDQTGLVKLTIPRIDCMLYVAAEGFASTTRSVVVEPRSRTGVTVGMMPLDVSAVSGELTVKEMTYEEIIDAGIDVTAPENEHVFQFQTELTFVAAPGMKGMTITPVSLVNTKGQLLATENNWLDIDIPDSTGNGDEDEEDSEDTDSPISTSDTTRVGFFPLSEYFVLVVYGQTHWLKEMFNVELMVINNNYLEPITDCEATLNLPEGLSLADMVEGIQSETIELGEIGCNGSEAGNTAKARWYVRGDMEGSYGLTASVTGMIGQVPFVNTFSSEDLIQVYAGDALELTVYADNHTFMDVDYHMTYKLENVSDKSLYNVSLQIDKTELSHNFHAINIFTGELGVATQTIQTKDLPADGSITFAEVKPGEAIYLDLYCQPLFLSLMNFADIGPLETAYYLGKMVTVASDGSTTQVPCKAEYVSVTHGSLEEETKDEISGEIKDAVVDIVADAKDLGSTDSVKNAVKIYRFFTETGDRMNSTPTLTIRLDSADGEFVPNPNGAQTLSAANSGEETPLRVYTDSEDYVVENHEGYSVMTITGDAKVYVVGENSGDAELTMTTWAQSYAYNEETNTMEPVKRDITYTASYHVHTEVTDEAVAPKCEETGLTEGKHCAVCQEVLVAQETVPALDHAYENGVCIRCGDSLGVTIIAQPESDEAVLGELFVVTVKAEGQNLKYQWYFRRAGTEKWSKSSVKDNTYDDVMTKARHNREVYCVITDAFGNTVSTDIATITAIPAVTLEITGQPESQSAALGEAFNVTVEAQGDDLRYQWYFRNSGSDRWYTSGQRDNSYDDSMTKARMGREIYCVITDAWGNSVKSNHAFLIGVPSETLTIVTQPTTQEVSMGEGFCATVEAVGDGLKYQWYFRNRGSDRWYTSGQRDNTYDDIMTKARMGREIYCVITDFWGNRVETEHVFLNAVPKVPLAITGQPADVSVPKGDRFCVTVEAQGEGLRYTWYFKNKGSNVWNRSGVTDNTYDDILTTARTDRQVYCVITDQYGNSVTSEVATIRRTQAS